MQEIENPELSQTRMIEFYKAKGYSDDWIAKRVKGIAVRDELTGEWKKRDVKEGIEYSILTAEISKATFLENKSGKKVVSKQNYKELSESRVRQLNKKKISGFIF